MDKLKKILNLANPLDNRIKAVKSGSPQKFLGYHVLGVVESLARGAFLGSTITYLSTNNEEYILSGAILGGIIDMTQHAIRTLNLQSMKKTNLDEHLKKYTWKNFS